MSFYHHSLLILASFLLVFVWQNSDFSNFTVPFIGFLIFLFLLISVKNKKNLNLGGPYNFFILNTVVLLLIFSTGGFSSDLFFLIYFLLFAAAFIMNPKSVFIFPVGAIIIFWQDISQATTVANLIKIASIVLFSPVAYFFGIGFRRNEELDEDKFKADERKKDSADQISEDVEKVLESGKEKLEPKEIEKLDDILEETESLRDEEK